MIPYGRQDISQADIDAVVDVLRSDFLTQGPAIPRFEQAVAERVRARHAVAVNSATSALHIAAMALGLQPGDRLWTVPNTFVASANCGRYCGADVDFVDIDAQSWNINVAALTEKLARAKRVGRPPKVLVPVHFAGQPTEQEAIWELSREHGFRVLEDASHAIGASRSGEPVGSCRWSDVTVFSFHPVKIITTGEGGMALTNDRELAERMTLLRSHGITRDPQFISHEADVRDRAGTTKRGGWYYEQLLLGFNYRMTDIQAALGASQLKRLSAFIDRRNELARRYDEALKNLPVQLPHVRSKNTSAFHLYVIQVKGESVAETRLRIFEHLQQRGIGVNLHYMPVHLQPYYRALGFGPGLCPVAEAYAEGAITLPLYPAMTDEQQDFIVHALREVL